MKAMIWAIRSTPFAFGGKSENVKSEIECKALVELGEGYQGYVFQSYDGKWRIAEKQSGALVGYGSSFSDAVTKVADDVRTGDLKVMTKQVQEAIKEGGRISKIIPEEEFLGLWGKKKK
jgi:hypothetical protein